MKKFIGIGFIIIIIAGIFAHDAIVEKQNRNKIAEINAQLAKNEPVTDTFPLMSLPKEPPKPGDSLIITGSGIEYRYDGTAPSVLAITPSQLKRWEAGGDISEIILEDRLSSIEQRLAEIEKMLKELDIKTGAVIINKTGGIGVPKKSEFEPGNITYSSDISIHQIDKSEVPKAMLDKVEDFKKEFFKGYHQVDDYWVKNNLIYKIFHPSVWHEKKKPGEPHIQD